MPAETARRYLPLAIGTVLFFGLLYSLGFGEAWRSLKRASYVYVLLTPLLFLAASYLRMYKWVLMRDRMGADISFSEIRSAYFSSKFWGLVTPIRTGEVVPALARADKEGRLGKLLSIILYDRVVETFQTLIVFGALFFVFYDVFFGAQTGIALLGILFLLGLFFFVMVNRAAGVRIFGWADRALVLIGDRRPGVALRRYALGLKDEMEEFYKATRSYFDVRFCFLNLAITFVCWGLDMLIWVLFFKALNIGAGLLVTVASVMVYSMVSALSPIPGGLGLSDMSFVLVLARFGYKGDTGGLIILTRILLPGYVYLTYAVSAWAQGNKTREA